LKNIDCVQAMRSKRRDEVRDTRGTDKGDN